MRRLIGIFCLFFALGATPATAQTFSSLGAVVGQFDPNSFGGGWWCIRSAASGTCGGATSHYFDAACDGVTGDDTQWQAYLDLAVAGNPTQAKLYIPPGSNCVLFTKNTLVTQDLTNLDTAVVQNSIIWAYGAKITSASPLFEGGAPVQLDNAHSAYINTVSAGSSTVTVNDGHVGRFSANDRVMLTGVCSEGETGGQPYQFQFTEYHQVTNVSGSTITLDSPLTFTYLQTWPICSVNFGNGQTAGPAQIFRMSASWNADLRVYGLTSVASSENIPYGSIAIKNVLFFHYTTVGSGISPSDVQSMTCYYCRIDSGSEIDKNLGSISFYYGAFTSWFAQSTPQNMVLDSLTAYCYIQGTGVTTLINNVTILGCGDAGALLVGPIVQGQGGALTVKNSTWASSLGNAIEPLAANYSYSNGLFTLPKASSSGVRNDYFRWATIGGVAKFAWHNAGTGACSPTTTFTITALTEDVTNFIITTGSWTSGGSPIATPAVLPTPDCHGNLDPNYVSYPQITITTSNNGASPSLSGFAPP